MKRFIIILLILLVACARAPVVKTEKAPEIAVLAVHSGEVLVNGSPAKAGQELKEGDVVKTSAASKASVVFFDSSVLRLDENTEITVKRISADGLRSVDLKQTSGQTWSRVLKLSGVKEYRIETPNTIATVRGTGFGIKVSDGDTKIMVKEGKVHVASVENETVMAEAVISADMQMEITEEAPAEMELEAMEHTAWIDENIIADEEFVDEVVEDYMEEHPEVVEGMEGSEEQIEDRVEEFVMGEITEEEMVEEAPVTPQEVVEEMQENITEGPEAIAEEVVERPVEEQTSGIPLEEALQEPVPDTQADMPRDGHTPQT